MADTFIQVPTDGTGKKLDTRTEGTNSEHRQVVVLGDPATNAGVAPVDATAGIKVNLGADNDVTLGGTTPTFGAGASDASTVRVTLDTGQVGSLGQAAMASSVSMVPASDFVGTSGYMKKEDVASANGDAGIPAMVIQKATPANTAGTDGDYEFLQASAGKLWVQNVGFATTVSTGVTRPADTAPYVANDCWSDSTSAPTSGGFTLTGAARVSGGSGIITDLFITSSNDPATLLQGEIWIADSAITNVNDNAAFAMTDGDALLLVGVVPFTLASTVAGSGTNSYAHLYGLNLGFTCVGSANLRFLVKVKNGYTPASGEVLTVRAKIIQTN